MKISKLLNTYLNHQIHLLLSVLKKKGSSFSENDFHSIRIAIKKIKALFALVEKSDTSFHQKKYFAPFKLVFELAGKIRDKEVTLSILHAYPYNASIDRFEFDLQHHISKEKKHFFKMTTPGLRKAIRHSQSKLSHFLDKINSKSAAKFLKKKKQTISSLLLNDRLDPTLLHEVRKQIKDAYYIEKMLHPNIQEMTGTDSFQDLLGQWHDSRVLLDKLNAYLTALHMSAENRTPYSVLLQRMTKENEDQFQHIMDKKQDLIKLFSSPSETVKAMTG